MSGYFSEISYDDSISKDFIEVVVPTGTDVSAWTVTMYDSAGAVRGSYGLGDVVTTVAGKDVYVINSSSPAFSNLRPTDGLSLSDDTGTVLQFVSFEGTIINASGGPADGLASRDIGSSGGNNTSLETTDQGASYSAQSAPNEGTITCYSPGTLIRTPDGARVVEKLRPGDRVTTLDNGPQIIRWTRQSKHVLERADDGARPVLIRAGALGRSLPDRDLIVSPHHRILVGGAGQLQSVFPSEAFVPARALTTAPGIRHMRGRTRMTWVHFACDRHEIVFANGCLSESILLGPMALRALSGIERRCLTDIFGMPLRPGGALNGRPARKCLTVSAARGYFARHTRTARGPGARTLPVQESRTEQSTPR